MGEGKRRHQRSHLAGVPPRHGQAGRDQPVPSLCVRFCFIKNMHLIDSVEAFSRPSLFMQGGYASFQPRVSGFLHALQVMFEAL